MNKCSVVQMESGPMVFVGYLTSSKYQIVVLCCDCEVRMRMIKIHRAKAVNVHMSNR